MTHNYTDISPEERQNAVISYCFLGIFILLSRQTRFQSDFINSHARVASIIQFLCILLVFLTIRSGNFWSMLIFDFSLSNVFYFIGFFILLLSLGMGIIRALQGKKPIITLRSLSLKEIARHVHPTNIDTVEKIPMALSHIPLIGNFVAAKYGASFSSGERFATWSVIIGIVFFWIDPSMTLVIILASLVTLWITYQSISLAIDDSISLLGDHLPHAKTVHIFLLSLIYYTKQLITSTHTTLPHWQHIISTIQAQYILEKKENVSQILALPLLNIVYIIKNIHTPGIKREIVQWSLLTLFLILSLIVWSPSWVFLVLYVSYTSFLSLTYRHIFALPFLQELSSFIIFCLNWIREKSKKETSSFTS